MFKVDLFVSDRSPLLVEEMNRRQSVDIGEPPRRIHVCTAEDIVVQKLDWFERGGRVSERQWNDLVGVLRVRGPALDREYKTRSPEPPSQGTRPREKRTTSPATADDLARPLVPPCSPVTAPPAVRSRCTP
jgi:hypothetical protein